MHFYREKQGLVPDFLIKIESDSTSAGGFQDALAELKFISAGLTYYNSTEKQVDIVPKVFKMSTLENVKILIKSTVEPIRER